MSTTATREDINRYADQVMEMIDEDIADGVGACDRHGPIPPDVPGFGELQSYVDANCYLLDVVPNDGAPECTCPVNRGLQKYHSPDCQTQTDAYRAAWDAYMDLCTEVEVEVDSRLRARTTYPACNEKGQTS